QDDEQRGGGRSGRRRRIRHQESLSRRIRDFRRHLLGSGQQHRSRSHRSPFLPRVIPSPICFLLAKQQNANGKKLYPCHEKSPTAQHSVKAATRNSPATKMSSLSEKKSPSTTAPTKSPRGYGKNGETSASSTRPSPKQALSDSASEHPCSASAPSW